MTTTARHPNQNSEKSDPTAEGANGENKTRKPLLAPGTLVSDTGNGDGFDDCPVLTNLLVAMRGLAAREKKTATAIFPRK
jgi:hypothetical protein